MQSPKEHFKILQNYAIFVELETKNSSVQLFHTFRTILSQNALIQRQSLYEKYDFPLRKLKKVTIFDRNTAILYIYF